jgi:hypothetical protein
VTCYNCDARGHTDFDCPEWNLHNIWNPHCIMCGMAEVSTAECSCQGKPSKKLEHDKETMDRSLSVDWMIQQMKEEKAPLRMIQANGKWEFTLAPNIDNIYRQLNREIFFACRIVLKQAFHQTIIGLTVNRSKMQVNLCRIRFLGNILDRDGLHPDPVKVKAISEYKPPRHAKEVKSFLWVSGSFSRFIQDYSRIVSPLSKLLEKNTKWIMSAVIRCVRNENFLQNKECSKKIYI